MGAPAQHLLGLRGVHDRGVAERLDHCAAGGRNGTRAAAPAGARTTAAGTGIGRKPSSRAVFVGTMVLTWALVMVGDSGLLASHRPAGIAAH